jgi:hypothetical protein
MGALAEVAATVRAGVADLNAVVAALYAARTKLEQARGRLVNASRGAAGADLPGTAVKLANAASRADESATLIVRATESLAHYSTNVMGFPLTANGFASRARTADNTVPSTSPVTPDWVTRAGEELLRLLP